MMLAKLSNAFALVSRRSLPPGIARRRCSSRLALEMLEDRCVPSTFTVTDLGDAGIGSHRHGDLRYAINAANANHAASNVIIFDPSLAGTITLTQGPLVISKDLDIECPGQDVITISGNHQSGVFNLTNDPQVQVVTISGLTIADGTGISVGGQDLGGGIYNDHADLTLSNCTVSGNAVSGNGGGIYQYQGTVTLNSSTVSANTAGSVGGGIYTYRGTVVLNSSLVSDNVGGGVYCAGFFFEGALTIDSTTLANNHFTGSFVSGGGGAIYSAVPTTITSSTISGNTAADIGGAIEFIGGVASQTIATISNSAIVGNTALSDAGVFNNGATVLIDHTIVSGNAASGSSSVQAGAGGLANNLGRMTITDCIISDNIGSGVQTVGSLVMTGSTVLGNAGDFLGGGLFVSYGDAQVSNCTFSGNTVREAGGGIAIYGLTTLELTSVTITGNTASGPSTSFNGGGGLFILANNNEYALVRNTLIAGNASATVAPDVLGTVISLGFNLVGEADGSQGWRSNDILGSTSSPIDPVLGPLQDNGGPTPTHAVLVGSPAIVHGDPALSATTDQRGTPRAHDGFDPPVDIGAFDATVIHSFSLAAPAEVVAGEPFTITVTALDGQGNTASTFTGQIRFSSSDEGAMLPANYTFISSDGGVATFTVTLQTAGAQLLQVDSVGTPDWRGTAMVQVDSPPAPRCPTAALADVFFSQADLADLLLPSPLSGRRGVWGAGR
jgi:hypothetical protein